MIDNTDTIRKVVRDVENISYEQRIHPLTQDENNNVIIEMYSNFKPKLNNFTNALNGLTEKYESLTWLDNPNEDSLKSLHTLITISKSFCNTINLDFNHFKTCNALKENNFLKTEIENYEMSIQDFTEVTNDLERVFFTLPKNKEFNTTTDNLKAL